MTATSVASEPALGDPTTWRFSVRGIAVRLFITCWLVYSLHVATNTVREIYLALAIADHLSFRVDEYANMHPDLFEKPGYGWHIGANPGASMLAAVPYAVLKPVIDPVVARVNASRKGGDPPEYNSPWPMAREFYRESWRRGFDVKFGIAAIVMQVLCMAPVSALAAVAMFLLTRVLVRSDVAGLGFALLYAFGTPAFFRTGYLNHNLMLGHFAFIGFLCLWNPGCCLGLSVRTRWMIGGLAGGASLLFDYTGVILLLALFVYGIAISDRPRVIVNALWFIAGSVPPVVLLWFYQWQSFGHPLMPGQHWMPAVEWIERGYQGFGRPQWELIQSLAVDYRYGLFTSCPLFLLALVAPVIDRGPARIVPRLEMTFLLGTFVAFWLFVSGINYTRLQFNTGIRYMAPMFPFLFVACAAVLGRLPGPWLYVTAIGAVGQAWCMAMYRDVERGLGLLEPVIRVAVGGFQLPLLTVLSRMGPQYGDLGVGVSPLFLFCVAGALIFVIWTGGARSAGNNR